MTRKSAAAKLATTTLNMRGVTVKVADRIRASAAARHMTLADYLTELVGLHDDVRKLADAGDKLSAAMLKVRGLETVTT